MRPLVILVSSLAIAPAALAQTDASLARRAARVLGLTRCEIVHLDLDVLEGSFALPVTVRGAADLIELHPYSLRARADFRALEVGADGRAEPVAVGDPRTYRGLLVGIPESMVAASVLDDGLHARLRLSRGDDMWITPLASRLPDAPYSAHALYSARDIAGVPGRAVPVPPTGGYFPPPAPPVDRVPAAVGSGVSVAELGLDTDFELFTALGSAGAVVDYVESMVNAMNVQFVYEVEIDHEITAILVRSTPNDPYVSTDPSVMLQEFKLEWDTNQAGIPRDYAHFISGKDMDGGVVGLGFIKAVCNTPFEYGIVQRLDPFPVAVQNSANILGFAWGADSCTCSGFTMHHLVDDATTFHSVFTEPEIRTFRDSLTCLDPGDGTEIFSDGFESGDLVAGGWRIQPNATVAVVTGSKLSGTYSARLDGPVWIEKQVSTAGFGEVTLFFGYRTPQYEPGDEIIAAWSVDGGRLWQIVDAYQGDDWQARSFALPPLAAGQPDFRLRFVTTGVGVNMTTGKVKRANLDVVRIIGE